MSGSRDLQKQQSDEEDEAPPQYSYCKCGSASVDNAVVAVQQLGHYADLVDNFECLVALCMFYVAWGVKLSLLCFFWWYWVEVKEEPFTGEFYDGMVEALHNTTRYGVPLSDKHYIERFYGRAALMQCSISRTPSIIHVMVLWVWFGTALNMIGDAIWRYFLVYCFEDGSDTNYKEKMDPPPGERQIKENIHSASELKKIMIYALVVTPDFLLNCVVAFVGAKYIAVTSEINFIVKASLKMNFLARMDKIIYPAFVSYNWENFIGASQYKVKDLDGMKTIGPFVKQLETFWGTVMKAVLGFIFALLFTKIFFGNIGELRGLCQDYYLKFPEDDVLPGAFPQNMAENFAGWHWYPNLR